jgi:hypothetical protein
MRWDWSPWRCPQPKIDRTAPMKRKAVYFNGALAGSAITWHEAAALVGEVLGRVVTRQEAVWHGSEGPDGFYIEIRD